jgi:hypothetical protein
MTGSSNPANHRRSNMRRARYFHFSFLLMVTLFFVACGGGGEQQTGQKSGVDEGAAAEQVEAGGVKAPK